MSRPRILIVDDDPMVLRCLHRLLTRNSDFVVNAVSDPRKVESLLEGSCYDIVISDDNMPCLNGYGVLELVAKRSPGTRRVLSNAMGTGFPDHEQALTSGLVEAVLDKPLEAVTVVSILSGVASLPLPTA